MRPRSSSSASSRLLSLFVIAFPLSAAPTALAQNAAPPVSDSVTVEPASSAVDDGKGAAPMGAAPAATIDPEKWRFSLTPYLWVPAMSGTVGLMGQSTAVDISQGDAFDALSDLDGAFTLHFEAQHGPISLFLDGMYANLESEETGPAGARVDVDIVQGLFELGAAYRVLDLELDAAKSTRLVLEPLAGVRVFYLESDLSSSDAGFSVNEDKAWANVICGVRGRLSFFNDTLGIFGRGDFGFNGSSDDSWNVIAGLDLRLATWCSLVGGYRWLNIDYSDEDSVGQFTYDVTQEGPFLAVEFRF